MTGRLGVDFGNANTVLALWTEGKAQAIEVAPYSRTLQWQDEEIPSVPSLIHYREDGSYLVGNEVLKNNLDTHPNTFIALKTTLDTLHAIQLGKTKISARQAAEDFLVTILKKTSTDFNIARNETVVFTVPVDTFEKYSKWLTDIALKAGFSKIRFVDEPAAAALSFGKNVKQNDDYLVFDFGAGSLDVAVVRFNLDGKNTKFGHCKVLGKKSMQLGGNNIDNWIAEFFIKSKDLDTDAARDLNWLLRSECRNVKEKLSFQESAEIAVTEHDTGKVQALELTKQQFIDILEDNEFFAKVDRTIQGAELSAKYDYGYKREKLAGLFMVGGTSIIPDLQKQLKRNFGKERVEVSRPLDSIADGAAAFASGASLFDHIQHDYAIEVHNIKAQKTQMKVIVQRGEKYPSDEPVASEIIKAVIYGQTKFQILIYEISKEEVESGSEFVDLAQTSTSDDVTLRYVCLNKEQPTLLETKRPVMKDCPALQIDFRIDENKHLTIDTFRFESNSRKVQQHKDLLVVRLA